MACNSLCFCFSGEPLRPDEYGGEGGRGAAYEKYATNRRPSSSAGATRRSAPLQCLAGGFSVTFICAPVAHAAPGAESRGAGLGVGELSVLPGVLAGLPLLPSRATAGNGNFPRTCMCLEACLCPGLAVSSTRFLLMDMYHLAADECDNRIARFNNFASTILCLPLHCDVQPQLPHLARLLDLIAIVFFATAGCMTAQVDAET